MNQEMSKTEWLKSLREGDEVAVIVRGSFSYITTIIAINDGDLILRGGGVVSVATGVHIVYGNWSIEPILSDLNVADLRTRLVLRISEEGLEKVSHADLQTISDILDKCKEVAG